MKKDQETKLKDFNSMTNSPQDSPKPKRPASDCPVSYSRPIKTGPGQQPCGELYLVCGCKIVAEYNQKPEAKPLSDQCRRDIHLRCREMYSPV